VQRYEGASTFYGRNTLEAYINLTLSSLHYLEPTSTSTPPAGPQPPDNRQNSLNFNTGVVQDGNPSGRAFGAVITQPAATYARGAVVSARFQGANPRNNLRLEGTFAAVERLVGGSWVRVRDDRDWFLTYEWTRTNWFLGHSEVVISWETAEGGRAPEPGTYRFRYYGDSKPLIGSIRAFEGTSGSFQLV
jgi:neutral ceramidase